MIFEFGSNSIASEQSRLGVEREMRAFYCQLEDHDSDGNRIRVQYYVCTPLRLILALVA